MPATCSPGPADALWLVGVAFLLLTVGVGTLVPLYAALFFRPAPESTPTRVERYLVAVGRGFLYFSTILVIGLAVALGLAVAARVFGRIA